MPTFEITSPEGKKYQIDAPDGATQEQALSYFQQEYKPTQETAPKGQDLGRTAAAFQGFNSAVPFGNRITAGLAAGGAALLAGDSDISSLYNDARANQKATSEVHPDYETGGMIGGIANSLPLFLAKGAGNLGALSDGLNAAKTTAGNFVKGGAGTSGKIARGAALAAGSSGLYGYGASKNDLDTEAAARDAGIAASMGAAGGVALPAAGAAIGSLAPKVEPGIIDVASTARKFNIPLSMDQVTGSRTLKNVQKVSQEIPFSGQQGFREGQMRAYNKALFKTVGVDADMFTPKSMSTAFSKVGGEFDGVTKGKVFNIGGDFVDNLAATANDVRSQYGEEAFNTFQREAQSVINDFSGDNISGELISRQRARINALARKAAPGQKEALLDLENTIVDGITSGDPAVQAALSQAKQRYKNLIVLEPIANKAKGGMISPSLLNNRVAQVYKRAHTVGNSGDIGDLARVGSELLPELSGSDTAQKVMIMKAAAYPSAVITGAAVPGAAIPAATMAGVGMGANRAFQAGVNRNQGLIDKQIMKAISKLPPEEAKVALEKLRLQQIK